VGAVVTPKAFSKDLWKGPKELSTGPAASIGRNVRELVSSCVLLRGATGTLVEAKALTLHLYHVGESQEAVEDSRGRRDIAEELPPILSRAIGCDERRRRFMATDKNLQEVLGSTGTELLHAEVLQHQQIDLRKALHESASLTGRFRLGEVLRQVEDTSHDRTIASSYGTDRDGDCDVGLPDTRWPISRTPDGRR